MFKCDNLRGQLQRSEFKTTDKEIVTNSKFKNSGPSHERDVHYNTLKEAPHRWAFRRRIEIQGYEILHVSNYVGCLKGEK